ncbi:MAG: YfhO family protein [Oscillospiraceae bacterium]|nr:YfhO family protein [Oscillospiraceae bacterium]
MKDNKIPVTLKFNLGTFLYNNRKYLWAFFIPIVVLSLAYFFFGVDPLNWFPDNGFKIGDFQILPPKDESVLVLDLNGQYVYYFENLRDIFWGRGSAVNSWSRNLSGEIIGIYAYYLASPFTLIVMLLPRSLMTLSIQIMQLCKLGTASIVMLYYLSTRKKYKDNTAIIFGIIYSLMGYMIVQLMDPMWLDGLIYLPLICKGIEKIIDDGKMLYLIIPLTLMFIANFYIGWMIAMFCILYFLVYLFSISEWPDTSKIKHIFISGVKFAVGGVLSAVCSAWLLVPLYFSLSLGKFEFTDPNFTMKTQFDFIDFFVNLLPNVYDTCRPEGSPVVYCGVLTILLVPLFFMNENIKLRNKIGMGLLALSIVLSMYMSTVDMAWHGFQVPNWLPYRYSFICSFVFILMAAQAFERIEGVSFKEIGGVFFLLFGYVLYVDGQELERVTLLATVWFTIALGGIYALLLYFYKKNTVKTVPVILLIFIFIELTVSSTYTIFRIDKDVVYSKNSSYNRYITLGRNTVDKIYEMDTDPVYRIESNYHRTVNDAMAFNSYGISHSSSTLNEAPIEFLRKLGFSYGGHYIKYKGSTYVSDAILGIRYVMEKGSAVKNDDGVIDVAENKHYDEMVLANGDKKEIFYVYENPYALPIGFMADEEIAEVELDDQNPFEAQNQLLSALASDTKADYFKQIEIDKILTENAKPSTYGSHSKYVPRVEGENSHIEFLVTAPTEDMVYVYFPTSYERKVNMWLNEEFVDYYFEGGNKVIQTLGRFAPGEQFSLITTITEEKNEVLFADEYFYYLDEEAFRATIDELKQNPLVVEEFREDHIKGTVTADEDGILFTSIAWEPGWTIKVDGEKIEAVQLAEALVGIPVTAGTHTIEMSFFPKGMAVGIMMSIAGVIIVVMIGILEKRKQPVLLNRLYED